MTGTIFADLDDEAVLALGLLKEDISVVGAAAGGHGVPPLLLRHALRCAMEAFGARGEAQHPAWCELVTAIDDLLIYRLQFPVGIDDDACARLRSFVRENEDVLEVEETLVAS